MPLDFKNIQEKSFVDIPASEPKVRLHLPRVGISNRPGILQLKNPLTGEVISMSANLRIASSLEANRRGVHMSRIEECMDELKSAGLTPDNFTLELGRMVNKTQEQAESYIDLVAAVEHRVSKNKSGKGSTELLKLHSEAVISSTGESIKSGVTVPFMNACPCTQRWAMRDFYNLLKSKGIEDSQAKELTEKAPLQAHTNGGEASLFISGSKISQADIYSVLDSSVPIVRELLKGIDEHTFVSMTHQQGQFCEDNIRAIAEKAVLMLDGKLQPSDQIHIKVEVNESVHFHNLWAELEKSFKELKMDFA